MAAGVKESMVTGAKESMAAGVKESMVTGVNEAMAAGVMEQPGPIRLVYFAGFLPSSCFKVYYIPCH